MCDELNFDGLIKWVTDKQKPNVGEYSVLRVYVCDCDDQHFDGLE